MHVNVCGLVNETICAICICVRFLLLNISTGITIFILKVFSKFLSSGIPVMILDQPGNSGARYDLFSLLRRKIDIFKVVNFGKTVLK